MTVLADRPTVIMADPDPAESAPPGPGAHGASAAPTAAGHVRRRSPPADASATTQDLLHQHHSLPSGHPGRAILRTRAIEANLALANHLARRYAGRGEPLEDLIQVAALGLVNAVDRYDHNRQAAFASFAVPTILGCLKRHFRDTAWGMRVPRSTQELGRDVAVAVGELSQLRGRPPTSAELATHLQTSPDAVAVALAAGGVYRPASLNAPQAGSGGLALIDLLGGIDPRYTDVDDHLDLRSMVAALPVRERRILTMRFTDGMTQHDIAVEVGVSQMQVSRLLAQSLTRLRAVMAGPSATTRCPPIATNTTNPGQDRFNRG